MFLRSEDFTGFEMILNQYKDTNNIIAITKGNIVDNVKPGCLTGSILFEYKVNDVVYTCVVTKHEKLEEIDTGETVRDSMEYEVKINRGIRDKHLDLQKALNNWLKDFSRIWTDKGFIVLEGEYVTPEA